MKCLMRKIPWISKVKKLRNSNLTMALMRLNRKMMKVPKLKKGLLKNILEWTSNI